MNLTCSDKGRAEAAALLEEVYERLGEPSDELALGKVDASNLLTNVVVSLNWDYRAETTGIHNDQWSAVSAQTYKNDDTGKPLFSTYVQCDEVEHGIAATWKAFADHFPKD